MIRKLVLAAFAAAYMAGAAPPAVEAYPVPALNYWKAAVREDAIQWCEVHSYTAGVKLYGCIYNPPSCTWAGAPYAASRGRCAMAWTMWPKTPARPAYYCVGRAEYVQTRNATAFKVLCSPLTYI